MPPGTPPPPHPANPSSTGPNPNLHLFISPDQSVHPYQEFLASPISDLPVTTTTLSPVGTGSNGSTTVSSCASSIHDDSASSTISDSGDSVSSLGGLNHVNDGVGGSTAQRRMSKVYSNEDFGRPIAGKYQSLNLPQQQQQQQGQGQQQQRPVPVRARSFSVGSLRSGDEAVVGCEKESCWKPWLRRKVPAFGWLISPGYSLTDLPDDLIAGITISTVVIPQSMAYAMLAPLPPVYGLYTSVAPILIYCIFGTSRHMHTGTFAITTLLLGQAVRGLMAKTDGAMGDLANTLLYDSQPFSELPSDDPEYERRFIGLLLMLSFVVGCIQVIMSFLRIGGWASKHLLPDALVGGFNTAAVFHIGTSQLKHFLGIKTMPSPQGAFALLKSWMWIGTHFLTETNWHTVFLGFVAIAFMVLLRKLEQNRKATFELELRKREMFMVQQRQAVSAAIVRNHEEQREQQRQQQRRWEQQQQQQQELQQQRQQQQKSDGGMMVTNEAATSPNMGSPKASTMASNISVRTANDENGNVGPSITFAPTTTRTPGDAEQALTSFLSTDPVAAVAQERQIYVPIPDILLAVILLTLANVIFSLDTPRSEGGWGIDVMGTIPKGLPEIIFPASRITSGPKEWMTLEFLKTVILPMVQPALLIAVVIYVMSFSIAKQFGKRYGYKVDANQEMLALGLASMGGSIFSGYACTGSLTRTAILSQAGAKTPLASMVGVATVILTLISLTWCFERVPNVVLAAIILVALQSLLMQITEPLKLWRIGQRKAALIWMVTFVGVLIVSVELGIAIGIAAVLLSTGYSRVVRRCRGEDEPVPSQRRRNSRRPSQGVLLPPNGGATGSLLNNTAVASAAANNQRRRGYDNGVQLSASASPASRGADWKRRMMRTKWGQRLGSIFGLERPIFSDTLHTNTDDDDY
ncbi:hypothetical protein BGZ58_003191 [Dissophora ornata]|nr:hypothetical protein BGZ58_003191 [Dissophora ornata]